MIATNKYKKYKTVFLLLVARFQAGFIIFNKQQLVVGIIAIE